MMSILEDAAFLIFLMAILFVICRSVRYDDAGREGKPKKFALRPKKKPESDPATDSDEPAA